MTEAAERMARAARLPGLIQQERAAVLAFEQANQQNEIALKDVGIKAAAYIDKGKEYKLKAFLAASLLGILFTAFMNAFLQNSTPEFSGWILMIALIGSSFCVYYLTRLLQYGWLRELNDEYKKACIILDMASAELDQASHDLTGIRVEIAIAQGG